MCIRRPELFDSSAPVLLRTADGPRWVTPVFALRRAPRAAVPVGERLVLLPILLLPPPIDILCLFPLMGPAKRASPCCIMDLLEEEAELLGRKALEC